MLFALFFGDDDLLTIQKWRWVWLEMIMQSAARLPLKAKCEQGVFVLHHTNMLNNGTPVHVLLRSQQGGALTNMLRMFE